MLFCYLFFLFVARLKQYACAAVAVAFGIGDFEADVVGGAVDVHGNVLGIQAFAYVGYLESLNTVGLISLERQLVHKQLGVAYAVDVLVDIEVAILEAVVSA